MICVVEFGAARGLGLAEEHPRRVYCVLNVMSLLSRPTTRRVSETCVLRAECNVIAFQAYDEKNM